MKQWWLSFADPTKVPGSQFLGVVIVEALSGVESVRKSHALNKNPGGEVAFSSVDKPVDRKWLDRLLTKGDIKLLRQEMGEEPEQGPDADLQDRLASMFQRKPEDAKESPPWLRMLEAANDRLDALEAENERLRELLTAGAKVAELVGSPTSTAGSRKAKAFIKRANKALDPGGDA